MAIGKEIKTKIRSIKSTQKITSAMELVAASKMRKVQERMAASRPYSDNMLGLIRHIGAASAEYRHPFTEMRPLKNAGVIVVSSDRGLCGALNYNLFRKVLQAEKEREGKDISTRYAVLGKKANAFFKVMKKQVDAAQTQLGEAVEVKDLAGSLQVMLDLYLNKDIDILYVAFNKFVNTMTQNPTLQQLLPLVDEEGDEKDDERKDGKKGEAKRKWDYLYEPEPVEILARLMHRYTESVLYQAVVENVSCEQAARMIAMKNATDNAGELIDQLQLVYNKARQAVITQEISEIVGGSEAL